MHPEHTLQDAVFQGLPLDKAISHSPYGIDLLAASSGANEILNLGDARLQMVVGDLLGFAARYDAVLFDCAAGISASVMSVLAAVPYTVVVATPYPTSLVDAYAMMKLMQQEASSTEVGLVLNMVSGEEEEKRAHTRLMGVVQSYLTIPIHYLGAIPMDDEIRQSYMERRPLLASGSTGKAVDKVMAIAKTILQKQRRTTRLEDLDARGLLDGILKQGAADAGRKP